MCDWLCILALGLGGVCGAGAGAGVVLGVGHLAVEWNGMDGWDGTVGLLF